MYAYRFGHSRSRDICSTSLCRERALPKLQARSGRCCDSIVCVYYFYACLCMIGIGAARAGRLHNQYAINQVTRSMRNYWSHQYSLLLPYKYAGACLYIPCHVISMVHASHICGITVHASFICGIIPLLTTRSPYLHQDTSIDSNTPVSHAYLLQCNRKLTP